jgi:sugar phosphate isomerase/epimerase
MTVSRRGFLQWSVATGASTLLPASLSADESADDSLAGAIGITMSSLSRHLSAEREPDKLRLLDVPRLMRDELDMRVIDLMTATFPSFEPDYLDQLRTAAEDAGCILTNIKMNQRGLAMGSDDDELRQRSLAVYKSMIDAAARLGCRWVRPLPAETRPDLDRLAEAFRELIDYGKPKGVSLLVENYRWISDDVDAIPTLIDKVGEGLAASPDIGNWNDDNRYEGLAKAFPHALTCDFKARELGEDGSHRLYDLERCFRIGWEAGFRGPWCFEHTHADLNRLLRDLALLRDMLREWVA